MHEDFIRELLNRACSNGFIARDDDRDARRCWAIPFRKLSFHTFQTTGYFAVIQEKARCFAWRDGDDMRERAVVCADDEVRGCRPYVHPIPGRTVTCEQHAHAKQHEQVHPSRDEDRESGSIQTGAYAAHGEQNEVISRLAPSPDLPAREDFRRPISYSDEHRR